MMFQNWSTLRLGQKVGIIAALAVIGITGIFLFWALASGGSTPAAGPGEQPGQAEDQLVLGMVPQPRTEDGRVYVAAAAEALYTNDATKAQWREVFDHLMSWVSVNEVRQRQATNFLRSGEALPPERAWSTRFQESYVMVAKTVGITMNEELREWREMGTFIEGFEESGMNIALVSLEVTERFTDMEGMEQEFVSLVKVKVTAYCEPGEFCVLQSWSLDPVV